MKPKLYFLILCAFSGVLLGAAFGPQRIRWVFQDSPVFRRQNIQFNGYVEFGLRDDGVVVWREITTTTNAIVVTTNSPAEREDSGVMILTNTYHLPYFQWTNEFVPFTNFWWYSGTNNIVPL